MKVFRFVVALLTLALFSCSSSDDDNGPAGVVPQPEPISTFHLVWADQELRNDTLPADTRASRKDRIFRFEDGPFSISFDVDGHFGYIEMLSNPGHPNNTQYFRSMRAFSSHYVNFDLISVDEQNKRVKGSFSGYVYHNPFDSTSEATFVSGFFDLLYSDNIPSILNYGVSAKLDGNEWNYTDWHSSQSSQPFYYSDHYVSDGPYKIMVDYGASTTTGIYNFNPVDASPKVRLSKYNLGTGAYIDYLCTGTMDITNREGSLFTGIFSFTAVNPQNPSEVISVTDGHFRTLKTL